MARNPLAASIPNAPLLDADGAVSTVWRAWFVTLQARTGGGPGVSSATADARITAETANRITAVASLGAALDTERTVRAASDAAEQLARIAADADFASGGADTRTAIDAEKTARIAADATLTAGLAAETAARIAADALLLVTANLRAAWEALDLSGLPSSDPGLGKPWLDGIHVAVGTSGLYRVGKEDATGAWALEDGTGAWEFT
jgi:hypothetical protein